MILDPIIKGKDESLRSSVLIKKFGVLNESNSPERIRTALDMQRKRLNDIQKNKTDERQFETIRLHENIASCYARLKQHYDAKECLKCAHDECQNLQSKSSATTDDEKQNALSLRVMLALAESYHALSSNKCNCFQPGDTCDRRRMSTAALNTSDNKDQEPEEEARPSDDLDWPSLSPKTGLKISQEDWFQYHNRGFVFG